MRENTDKIDEQRLRIGTCRGGLEYNLKSRWEITEVGLGNVFATH